MISVLICNVRSIKLHSNNCVKSVSLSSNNLSWNDTTNWCCQLAGRSGVPTPAVHLTSCLKMKWNSIRLKQQLGLQYGFSSKSADYLSVCLLPTQGRQRVVSALAHKGRHCITLWAMVWRACEALWKGAAVKPREESHLEKWVSLWRPYLASKFSCESAVTGEWIRLPLDVSKVRECGCSHCWTEASARHHRVRTTWGGTQWGR